MLILVFLGKLSYPPILDRRESYRCGISCSLGFIPEFESLQRVEFALKCTVWLIMHAGKSLDQPDGIKTVAGPKEAVPLIMYLLCATIGCQGGHAGCFEWERSGPHLRKPGCC